LKKSSHSAVFDAPALGKMTAFYDFGVLHKRGRGIPQSSTHCVKEFIAFCRFDILRRGH